MTTTPPPPHNPPPTPYLVVHVLWHKLLADKGRADAEIIYKDLCRDPDRPMASSLGIPVFFHTAPPAAGSPDEIRLDAARHTAVVLLVDPHMAVDPEWKLAAHALADATLKSHHRHVLLPVAMTDAPCHMDLLRIQRLPLRPGAEREVSLRLRLASELCRLLLQTTRAGDAAGELSTAAPRLFISHAKRDAAIESEEIHLALQCQGVDTFFDKFHIAPGADFASELIGSIKHSALLAWQSDEYAARPWCNIELITAKRHLRPVVAVVRMKVGEERTFPYLGNVRTVVSTGNNGLDIIAAAVREYLRKLHSDGRMQLLTETGAIPPAVLRLFRQPEPIDAALALQATPGPTAAHTPDGRARVMYPDPPIGTAEREVMEALFPTLAFVTPATADGASFANLVIALSISEPDTPAPGLSPLHLRSAMIEIARHILARGGAVAYGGDLRPSKDSGFTRLLLELVHAHADSGRGPVERIVSYLPHHVAAELSIQEEADLQRLARFNRHCPEQLLDALGLPRTPRTPICDDSPLNRFARARCLTLMRTTMAHETHARIILGGRSHGHQGKYPGLLEEALITISARRPLFVVGGFGGCAELIARVLRGEGPEQLARTFQLANPRRQSLPDGTKLAVPFLELESSYAAHAQHPVAGDGLIDYQAAVAAIAAAGPAGLNNGLSDNENRELFTTPDLDRIITLVLTGLARRLRP